LRFSNLHSVLLIRVTMLQVCVTGRGAEEMETFVFVEMRKAADQIDGLAFGPRLLAIYPDRRS